MKIDIPYELESTLNNMPGVIENGLFAKRTADIIIQATNSDILTRKRYLKY
jgi:ribose 5-phosphate isomerase A